MASSKRVAVKFSEAIEFLRRAVAIGADEWLQILAEEGVTSSAIADDTTRSVIESMVRAVLDVLEEGGTLETFRADYDRIVAAAGWTKGGDWHSQLIFRLWTNLAYSAGKWEQAQRLEQARPGSIFVRLVTVGDHRVRHSHEQMHGIVLPLGHPYWLTHWPPNGFNCRCSPQILTRRDLARYGYEVTADGDPRLAVEPDEGFDYNPGIVGALARFRQRTTTPAAT